MNHLETFRKEFPSVRVMVYEDCMVYSVQAGFGMEAAKSADELIRTLELPLVVEVNPINDFSRTDSFIVKNKN